MNTETDLDLNCGPPSGDADDACGDDDHGIDAYGDAAAGDDDDDDENDVCGGDDVDDGDDDGNNNENDDDDDNLMMIMIKKMVRLSKKNLFLE